ncbi:MAG TPA: hypothetical protein VHW23_42570 [Kofleriaceae bacterium]|nr:hypothetical protein [Kofleriaceae bacterium]
MRRFVLLLHVLAAAAALLFIVLALLYVVLAAWTLWERQVAAFAAMAVLSAFTGYVGIRVLIALEESFLSWHRQWLADQVLPRAVVVVR